MKQENVTSGEISHLNTIGLSLCEVTHELRIRRTKMTVYFQSLQKTPHLYFLELGRVKNYR